VLLNKQNRMLEFLSLKNLKSLKSKKSYLRLDVSLFIVLIALILLLAYPIIHILF
jgi:hypothetical protein